MWVHKILRVVGKLWVYEFCRDIFPFGAAWFKLLYRQLLLVSFLGLSNLLESGVKRLYFVDSVVHQSIE